MGLGDGEDWGCGAAGWAIDSSTICCHGCGVVGEVERGDRLQLQLVLKLEVGSSSTVSLRDDERNRIDRSTEFRSEFLADLFLGAVILENRLAFNYLVSRRKLGFAKDVWMVSRFNLSLAEKMVRG